MRGFSILIACGRWAMPTVQRGAFIKLRICLGFIAISFYDKDMERYLGAIMSDYSRLKAKDKKAA